MVGSEGKYGASSYASRLTPRQEKGGGLGNPEHHDKECVGASKIVKLVELIRNAKKCVVLTGAGISTSAGVSDFRGPNGVWTAEKKGVAPPASRSFDVANPTLTHMALVGLVNTGHVSLVISQNVDGLHLRSGIPRSNLAELHGNLFMETCEVCGMEYLRDFDVGGISCRKTGRVCTRPGCGGALRDNLLDWEDALPEREFVASESALRESDLCICMGTSLRIRPASELPLHTVRNGGKLVLINLQKTPKDRHAHLLIHLPVDQVMRGVMALLREPIPTYRRHIQLCKSVSTPPSKEEDHKENNIGSEHNIGDADGSNIGGGSHNGGGAKERVVEVFSSCGRHEALPLIKAVSFKFSFDSLDGPDMPVKTVGPPYRCTVPRGAGSAHAELRLVESCTVKHAVMQLQLRPDHQSDEDDDDGGGGDDDDRDGTTSVEVKEEEEVLAVEMTYPPDDREEEDRIMSLAKRAPPSAGNKRKQPPALNDAAHHEGQRRGKDWRECATCKKWGRPPRTVPPSEPYYCRRRCMPEGEAASPLRGAGFDEAVARRNVPLGVGFQVGVLTST